MAEIYKFFNSAPGDERWYYASDFAEYFGDVLSSGLLYEEGSTNLQVRVVAGTLKTVVEPGKALIKGYRYWNTTMLELTHSIPEIDTDRIDRIVLRMDIRNNARSIRAFVKEGVSALEPVPPELQRDNYVYELSLAQVRVTKNTASLVPENLVDERMIEELCGTVSSIISVPTTVFQQQWDVWFNSKKATLGDNMDNWMIDQQQAFVDWFVTIQNILDGDVAGNLANYITEVDGRLTSHLDETDVHLQSGEREKWNDVAQVSTGLKTIKENRDSNGIFTVVSVYRKSDDSLYQRSVLSGGTSPQYTTRTITTYATDGETVLKTDVYTLAYDADGALISEV